LPLAVILYDRDLDQWQPGAHAGTFRGNTLAMAAGLATLKTIREQHLVEHAALMGARLCKHLRQMKQELPMLGEVRGRGLMVGVEIVNENGQPDALGHAPADGALASRVRAECLARGLIIEMGGRHGAVARFLAPLIITPEQIDTVADLFQSACRAALAAHAA
jgi:diaminobutyrate-2-oxoglutarate transaminase